MTQTTERGAKWEAFKQSFRESNYITDFWNWFMTLMSKAAELVLFASVLYSGYQMLPGISHASATIDAVMFVIQQAALDVGGMGLLKLGKRAGLPRDSFPMRVGVTLVVLMIINVVLASVKQSLPMVTAPVFQWIEVILLALRAVMAVLFGHAIHALRDEYGETTLTVKEARELWQHMEELSSQLAQRDQLAREQLAQMKKNFHERLHESASELAKSLQEEFARRDESLQQVQAILALVAPMKAQIEHLESSTLEQIEYRTREHEKQSERPALQIVPTPPKANSPRVKEAQKGAAVEKPDARAFVFTCLEMDPNLKLADIAELSRSCNQQLSQSTISRYRKEFFAKSESSTMKVEAHESSAV